MSHTDSEKVIIRLTAVIILFAGLFWGWYQKRPPEPKRADVPATEFSAVRAMEHIRQIAQQPHPAGSIEHARVRAYLIDQLKQLGLRTSVRRGTVGLPQRGEAAVIRNIVGQVDGTEGTRTILLMAHYDSVPTGPGAADDASGIAAILETLRAQLSEGKPAQNLMVLFSDAEEYGLLGAMHFFRQDSLSKKVDLVINFEARGTGGPSMMFETSTENAELIQLLSKYTSHPVANSLTYNVYKRMPNDTDFTLSKEADKPGYNFAFIEGLSRYHTSLDDSTHLSRASLQHDGSNLMGLLHRLNSPYPVNLQSDHDAVYFNHILSGLTYYPEYLTWVLALILLTLWILAFYKAHKDGRLTIGKTLGAVGSLLVVLIVVSGLSHLLWQYIHDQLPDLEWMHYGLVYHQANYFAALLLLALGLVIPILGYLQRFFRLDTMIAAALFIWIIPALFVAWRMPGASYLLIWPALFAVLGWGYEVLKRHGQSNTWAHLITWGVVGFPILYLVSPYIQLLILTLTIRVVGFCILLTVLLVILTWPLISLVIKRWEKFISLALVLAGLLVLIYTLHQPTFDSEHPRPVHLNYAVDATTGRAYWISRDPALTPFTGKYLTRQAKRRPFPKFTSDPDDSVWVQKTALDSLDLTKVRVHKPGSSLASWDLDIIPQAGSTFITIKTTHNSTISEATINQHPAVDTNTDSQMIRIFGAGRDTLRVQLSFENRPYPETLEILDYRAQLPEKVDGKAIGRWPDDVMPRPGYPGEMSRATLIHRTVKLMD